MVIHTYQVTNFKPKFINLLLYFKNKMFYSLVFVTNIRSFFLIQKSNILKRKCIDQDSIKKTRTHTSGNHGVIGGDEYNKVYCNTTHVISRILYLIFLSPCHSARDINNLFVLAFLRHCKQYSAHDVPTLKELFK